jgi:predicted Zn-dependent peptidase
MQESKELDVELNLKDEAFKKEVKKLIDEHLSTRTDPTSRLAVQNTDLLLPNNKSGQSYGGLGRGGK